MCVHMELMATKTSTQQAHSFIHSFIYLYSIDHTDVEFVSKYKYKQFVLNIGIGRHQLYTNAISDKDIHVITEHKFSTFPFISSTYKRRVLGAAQFNANIAPS